MPMMLSVGFSTMLRRGCAKVGSARKAATATPPMIEPMLKNDDASAGMPKRSRALSTPIACAASATSKMNGIIICVMRTVSANLAGFS